MNLTDGTLSAFGTYDATGFFRIFIWEEFIILPVWRILQKILLLPLDGSPGTAIAKMLSKKEFRQYILML